MRDLFILISSRPTPFQVRFGRQSPPVLPLYPVMTQKNSSEYYSRKPLQRSGARRNRQQDGFPWDHIALFRLSSTIAQDLPDPLQCSFREQYLFSYGLPARLQYSFQSPIHVNHQFGESVQMWQVTGQKIV